MPFSRVSRFGFVNSFLVEDDGGLTVIDTMIPRSAKGIVAAADEHGMPIARILLTHAHQDHIGSLDELHALVPEAEVIIGTRERRLLKKDMSLDPGEPVDKLRGGYSGAEVEPTRTMSPASASGSLEAHAAPGHTPGQLAFLDTRDGTLYCADAYSTLGGVASPRRQLALPASVHGHLAPADRARDGEGTADARPSGSPRATVASSRTPPRRWTPRSRRRAEPELAGADRAGGVLDRDPAPAAAQDLEVDVALDPVTLPSLACCQMRQLRPPSRGPGPGLGTCQLATQSG